MAITIQKSDSGATFTVQNPGDVARPYKVNSYEFIPLGDNIHFSLIHEYRKAEDQILIDNQPYTNIINGDTGLAFADFATCQSYILTNFFRKAGGGSSSSAWGSITGTLSDQNDLQTELNGKEDVFIASNGLTPDVGTLKLGGTLTGTTSIDTNGHFFEVSGNDETGVTHDFTVGTGTTLITAHNNNLASAELHLNGTTGQTGLSLIYKVPSGSLLSEIFMSENSPGILILDSANNVGLIGDQVFSVFAREQYTQVGNVQAALNLAVQEFFNQTTSQTVSYTPFSSSMLRVNVYSFYRSNTGSVSVTIDYADTLGNPQSISLGTVNSVTPVTNFPPAVIKVGGAVTVTFTVTGTIGYDAGATIENLTSF